MKKTYTLQSIGLIVMLLFTISIIHAQNSQDSLKTNTAAPVMTSTDTTPPPPPPPPAEPAKEKKDGFNSKTRFGIRAGGIISKQDYESSSVTENPESKFGADLAILASFPIGGGFFTVQPELHWLQKGYKLEDISTGNNVTTTLNYLELPLLLRVNFGGSLRVFGFAGPSIGFLLSGTIEGNNGTTDPTEYLDDIEYSGYIGIGAGIGTLELDLRYMAGLSDISDSPDLENVKNSSLGAGLTLKF